MLLAGFTMFTVASIGAALSPNFTVLIAFRLLQALAVGVGTVASRAVIRDCWNLVDGARVLGSVTAAMTLAPLLAPAPGGWLAEWAGGRSVFAACAVMGALVLSWVAVSMPETRPAEAMSRLDGRALRTAYGRLLRAPRFLAYAALYGFANGAFFAFLAVAPDFFDRRLGIGAGRFGMAWALLAAAYLVGALLGRRLVGLWGIARTLTVGTAAFVAMAWSLPASLAALTPSAASLLVPMALVTMATGVINPLALALAIDEDPALAGTASGLASALGMLMGAAFSVAAGASYDGTATAMALWVAIAGTAGVAAFLMATRGAVATTTP